MLTAAACSCSGSQGRAARCRCGGRATAGGGGPVAGPPLPAAVFGGVEFPNVAELAPAGPGRVLGCSSAGSVALWDYAR